MLNNRIGNSCDFDKLPKHYQIEYLNTFKSIAFIENKNDKRRYSKR